MTIDSLNRKISFATALFACIGVITGVVALTTNYWTLERVIIPGTAVSTVNGTLLTQEASEWKWNGLFYFCSKGQITECKFQFSTITFVLCLLGLIFLLFGGISVCWDVFQISDRRYFIPMSFFTACVLMTAGLFEYGSWSRLNSHSSRAMIASTIFAYVTLPISAFLAGRYSSFTRFITTEHVINGHKYVSTSTN